MSYIDCEKCIHYQICCGYTSKEAIAESNRAMNNGESLLCFMYTPTADVVEVRHGRWIFEHDALNDPKGYFVRIVCSECGLKTGQKANYCPNCGAKMDGERREK